MYRKYYNSSYYIAKTQENSPVRLENGQYLNQPLIDQTNLQSKLDQQTNGKIYKNNKQKESNSKSINLKSLVQNSLVFMQQQNLGNGIEQAQGDKSSSFIKRYNSSQKRVKTQSNTPEKQNSIRQQQNIKNSIVAFKNEQNQLGNRSFVNSNTQITETSEVKQGLINPSSVQHIRARSNGSMVVQKMNIQKMGDTLKSHKAALLSANSQSQTQDQYSNLNKLLLNGNQSYNFGNHLQQEDNQPSAVISNQNIYIKRKEQQQSQVDQIRSQSCNPKYNHKLINTSQTENDTSSISNNQKQLEEEIKQTLEREAVYYLQDRFTDKSRKNTPSVTEQAKNQTLDESQYTFDKINFNNNREDTNQNKRLKSGLKPPQNIERLNRINDQSFNSIKGKLPKYPKNIDNLTNTRQTNSSLSTYTPHDGSSEDKTIEGNNNKSSIISKTEVAQINNYLETPDQSKEKQYVKKQNIHFTTHNSPTHKDEQMTQQPVINYTIYDYSRNRSISPFDRRPLKKVNQQSAKRTATTSINASSTIDKNQQEQQQENQMTFTTIQNDQILYPHYNTLDNSNSNQKFSKEKLKKMQLSFLNNNENPLNNICNLLKKNKQILAKNNKSLEQSETQNSNLLKATAALNQQHVSNIMQRISQRSQSLANGTLLKANNNIRMNITPDQRRASQHQLPSNYNYRNSIDRKNEIIPSGDTVHNKSQNQANINIIKERRLDLTHSFRTKKGVMASNPKKQNQDSFFMSEKMSNDEYEEIYFLGVMDGHGSNGHFVSQFIKNNIVNEYKSQSEVPDYEEKLINLTDSLNSKLADSNIDCLFSGTTMISLLLLINKDELRVFSCNCGDSRAIMGLLKSSSISQQNNQINRRQAPSINSYFFEVLELSRDHKPELPDEKERIISQNGRIDSYRDEFGNQLGPMRVWLKNENIPGLAMSRSIGDDIATSVGVTWEPEIKEFNIQFQPINSNQRGSSQDQPKDDINIPKQPNEENNTKDSQKLKKQPIIADSGFIVIGSDGVWEFLPNEDIIKEVGKYYILKDIEGACNWLLNEAYQKWTCEDDSVVDDITFIILFFQPKEILQKSVTAKKATQSLDFDL